MSWFIPREHGAWAMLIVPFLLGMLASQSTWIHLVFFTGVLALYFSSGPLLAFIRKPSLLKEAIPAFMIYLSIGIIFTAPVLYMQPKIILLGLFIVPFFAINIWFAKLKKERLFINDIVAITALSFLVLISYYIGNGLIDNRAILVMVINIIFFTASVFHVKTLIREKGNQLFLKASYIFHLFTVIVFLFLALPFVALAFFFGSLKAFFMPKNKRYKPIQIGLIEIANSVLFVLVIGLFF